MSEITAPTSLMSNIEAIRPASPLHSRMLSETSCVWAAVEARRSLPRETDREAVRRAWATLVASEPELRSCFVWHNLERPVQVTYSAVDSHLEAERCREWRLTDPHLVRCIVGQTTIDDCDVTIQAAAVLLDETSVSLVLDRLLARLASDLDEQYHTPANEQRQHPRRRDEAAAHAWWTQVQNTSHPMLIPESHLNTPARYRRRTIPIPLTLVSRIEDMSVQLSVPLEAPLLAAWTLLLSRLASTSDVRGGLVMDGRTEPDSESIGRFRAIFPLQTEVSEMEFFSDLIDRCGRTYRTMMQHCLSPPEKTCYVDTALTLIDETSRLRQHYQLHAPLELRLRRGRSTTQLEAVYRSSAIGRSQVVEIMTLFADLLERVPSAYANPICNIPTLRGDLRLSVIKAGRSMSLHPGIWNGGGVLRVLEERCAASPEEAILASKHGNLTCAELNRRVNRLARYLLTYDAGPEVVVALLLRDTLDRIIWELAILKAGAAFLPLDPKLPSGRLNFVFEDSRASLIVADREFRDVCSRSRARAICPELEQAAINSESAEPLRSNVNESSLAYVMYTSGSTGTPKGVAIHHGGLYNMASAQSRRFGGQSARRVLQFASAGFDASVSELFATLLSNGVLCLPDNETLQVGSLLHETLKGMRISQVTLPPSALRVLDPEDLPDLKSLVSAGEACSPEIAQAWAREGREVWNAYGPTEVTVCASMGLMQPGKPVHLGSPIDGFSLYVLDSRLEPIPFGVAGELYISGPGLARGYWGRPGLTAEHFLPDPFHEEPGSRMYRSGDRVVRQRDGRLMFLGRTDRQVKVRGFRIEPEEIERTLLIHSDVDQAAVVVSTEESETRIIAYIADREAGAGSPRTVTIWPSVAEHFVYDDLLYQAMLDDAGRMEFYRRGLRSIVAEKVAVDIGTGPEAILARICIEEGASKVYAIELLEESARRARALVDKLGLSDRIVVISGSSQTVSLPELAEVCVSGLVGPIGGVEGVWNILQEAKRRFLTPTARFVPTRSVTMIGAVSIPGGAGNAAFSETSAHYAEKIFSETGHPYPLRLCLKGISPGNIVSSTSIFEDLDFQEDHPYEWARSIRLTIERPAQVDGLLLWLTLHTTNAARIDTLSSEHCWLPVFFPVFWPGILLSPGDEIRADCVGKTSPNGVNPDYSIKGVIVRQGAPDLPFDYAAPHQPNEGTETGFYTSVMPEGRPRVPPPVSKSAALKTYLGSLLPAYMIPSDFIFLRRLPLTINGKIDYAALPTSAAPDLMQMSEPQDEEESVLTEIWKAVLPGRRFGTTDNFFDVGGTSLLAAEVQILLHSKSSYDIPLVDILKYPTIRSLADRLRDRRPKTDSIPAEQLQVGRRTLLERAERRHA
jgi:amino acid adenylation domain-containing protein